MVLLPNGSASQNYINEVMRLPTGWINDNAIKDIAFKTLMIMVNLVLQKPSELLKAKDHLKALKRRLLNCGIVEAR